MMPLSAIFDPSTSLGRGQAPLKADDAMTRKYSLDLDVGDGWIRGRFNAD